MRRRIIPIIIVLVVIAGGVLAWRLWHTGEPASRLTLYGDIDVRQVDLAFKVAGRIAALTVDEGDAVKRGQVLASLDKSYFDDDIRLQQARIAGQSANLLKLKHGSRPEEIAQARAALAERKANLANAQVTYSRQEHLLETRVTSRQSYDNAAMTLHSAQALTNSAQAALDLVVAGPRVEDIAAAQAQLDAEAAQLVETRRRLADADLVAPDDGIVLTRARERGAIVQPGETVFTLTLDRQVWVRAYVGEPELGRVRPGMKVAIHTDAANGKTYRGAVGFISPLAEFTPKSVETAALRTDLVYRLRIIVADPDAGLRQGMPVTVSLDEAR
ncbi:MAG TPA: secretion protein HlyD [Stellaceae bacterium]